MKTIIDTYDSSSHSALNNKSPNQVFKDNDDQMTRHLKYLKIMSTDIKRTHREENS